MRSLRHTSATAALALGLATSSAPAQSPPPDLAPRNEPATPKPNATPAQGSAGQGSAGQGSTGQGSAAQGSAGQGSAASAQGAAGGTVTQPRPPAATQPPQPMRQRSRKKAARKAVEAQILQGGPVATFPGFRMLPDGSSRVFVQVSKKVDVSESKATGRVVYRMKGVQTIQTNQYPLITGFFPTPVGKVQLVPQGGDLDMVIELRQPSDVKHRVMETERGIVVQVDFPALLPGATLATPSIAPPTAQKKKQAMQDEGGGEDSF